MATLRPARGAGEGLCALGGAIHCRSCAASQLPGSAAGAGSGARAGNRSRPRCWPSCQEPASEKCNPSGSQWPLHFEKGTMRPTSTYCTTPCAAPTPVAHSSSTRFSCCQLARYASSGSAAAAATPFGGTESTTVRTPWLWHAMCSSWTRVRMSSGEVPPSAMSLVPSMINARSKGPCSVRSLARPGPVRFTMSLMLPEWSWSASSDAFRPLRPQTQTSAATCGPRNSASATP
mmetsp:Transcript_29851/g.95171  ORF Transcript_29851/g.95171 Transcript_29851/m.95171 type:complete len:233 (+) Transcript_29851:164-862(+)